MPTRPFSDLYDYVLPYVPSAETRLVDFHIRRVTREFCRRTTLWRRRVELMTSPGVEDYILSPYDAALPVEGGGGGGGGGWTAAGPLFSVLSVSGNGDESVTYDNASSVLSLRTSSEFADSTNFMEAFFRVGTPGAGYRTRFTFLPLYWQGALDLYKEYSYSGSSYFPITSRSYFTADGTDAGAFGGTFTNDAGTDELGVIREWFPNPLEFTDGRPGGALVDQIQFVQGVAFETATTVAFNALVEVYQNAPAAEPEICDPYSILTVTLDGKRIDPIAESDRKPYGARPNLAKPKAWYQPSARVLHLYPAPDAAYPVVVDIVCALTMEPTLDVMPDFLIADYREVIADGVVASLKMLNGKPWFDPEGAREFAMRFRNGTQAIRSRLRDAYRPGSFVARGPTFGR